MNESKQRRNGAILSYVSIFLNTIIQLIYTPLLIRSLGQSEYGLYSLATSIIGYLSVMDLGFGNAIIVFSSKYKAQNKNDELNKLLGMFKIIYFIIGFITAILGLVLFFTVDFFFSNSMTIEEIIKVKLLMLILSFNLMFTFSFSIYSSVISAYERFTFQKLLSIISSISKPLLMIPLLFLGFKSITLSLVITFVNIACLISNFLYCRYKLNLNIKYIGFDKNVFKTVLGYSIWLFIGSIVDKANWSVDNFILGSTSGTNEVSIYSVAATLNTMFISLSTALSGVFLPKISKLVAKKADNSILSDEFIKVGRLQFYVIFLACSGLLLFGKEFILLWAGNSFENSYYVALLLIIPISIPLIQNLGLSIMQAMNKFKFKSITTFVMAVANIFISIFLAKLYGAIGAAIGTALSLIICNVIIMNIYYYKVIKLDIFRFWSNIAKMFVVFQIPVIVSFIFDFIIKLDGIKFLIINIPLYIVIYAIISYFVVMNEYEKNIVKSFINKLNIKKITKKKIIKILNMNIYKYIVNILMVLSLGLMVYFIIYTKMAPTNYVIFISLLLLLFIILYSLLIFSSDNKKISTMITILEIIIIILSIFVSIKIATNREDIKNNEVDLNKYQLSIKKDSIEI